MHNAYFSSTLLSIGTHGSVSISSNDCSTLFCQRFERTPFLLSSSPPPPSRCCGCCSCCAYSSLVSSSFAIQPSYLLYGLRQSSLIQRTPSRTVNLGARSRRYDRVPGGYEVSCSFEESSGSERTNGRRSRQFNFQPTRCLDIANDAEAVINLLSEEVSEEYLDRSRRNGMFSERFQNPRRRKEGSYGGECESERKKNLRLRLLASKSKCELESKKENSRMKEEKNEKKSVRAVYKGETRKVKTDGASLSSYYSLSSEGSDKDEAREEEEPSSGCMNELGECGSQVPVVGNFQRHDDVSEKQKLILEHRRTTSMGWDLRKKSEKKLTDVEETDYSRQSSPMQPRLQIDDVTHKYKVFDSTEESSVGVSQEKGATSQYNQRDYQALKQTNERNNQKPTDRQEIHERGGERTSQYNRLFPGGEGMAGRSGKHRISSQEVTRTKIQEERKATSSHWGSSRKHDQIGANKAMGQTEELFEMSEGHQQYEGNTSSTHSNTRMKNQRESTSSFSASDSEATGQKYHSDKKAVERVQSRKAPEAMTNLTVNVTNASLVNATTNTETVANSQRISGQVIVNEGGNTSIRRPIQETGGFPAPADENYSQLSLIQDAQRVAKASSLHRKSSERAYISEAAMQQDDPVGEAVMVPPSHQLVAGSSFHVDSTDWTKIQDFSEGTSLSYSGGSNANSRENVPEIHQELEDRDLEGEQYDDSLHLRTPEDALGSVRRLEASSMHYLGEFVERAKHEVSSETDQHQANNSRPSSNDSGEKGPSAEMWDVTDPSVRDHPTAGAQEERERTSQAGTIVSEEGSAIRKSGRSLWGMIGDIVKFRWGSHAETSKSANSGGKSASNNSARSEAWFSGHDPEENSGHMKKQTGIPKGRSSDQAMLKHTSSSKEHGEASGTGESKPMAGRDEVVMVPPVVILSGSTSREFVSPEKDLDWSPDEKRSEAPSRSGGDTSTISLPSSSRSSPIAEQRSGNSRSDTSGIGIMEQPSGSKVEASSSGEKDGELKQRKLQRNKQFVRDRFDDWEEAYIIESEQRKTDEMFMREALIEARKAADTWEVPVGAVLVQHGKIIARGHNLVEELRDSTAHAEMICIREASSQLRSWRLAETTLYVTLEPCPMCAGAILQARIDTVVWGAPNKLLGADGSWIRMFPKGEGGHELETDKPAPPVHPFHPKMKIRRGVLVSECADAMKQFFQLRRNKVTKEEQEQQQPIQNTLVRAANHPSKILKKMHDIFHVMFCL